MARNTKEGSLLYYCQSKESESDNVWDDTLLIQMWDRSIEKVKNGPKKLLPKQDQKNGSCQNGLSRKRSESFSSETSEAVQSGIEGSTFKQRDYYVGQNVRAPYSEDLKDYEAVITSLQPWSKSCSVKFIGYGNREEVLLENLKTSHGVEAVHNQVKQARLEGAEGDSENNMEFDDEVLHSSSKTTNHLPRQGRGSRGNAPNFPSPPVMPMITPPTLHSLSHRPHADEDAFTAMLMSWYMSGYHTGYYEGLKRGKECAEVLHTKQRQPSNHYYKH